MSERLVGILVDSFGKILLPGLTVTIPLTVISFTLALYIEVGIIYLLFCTVLTRLQAVGEKYLNSKGAQRS